MPSDSHSVVLSVSGLVMSLNRKLLNKYPNTRLAQQFLHTKSSSSNAHSLMNTDVVRENALKSVKGRHYHADSSSKHTDNVVVYFFNRNPLLFLQIIDFYRTGMLHFPHQYCWTAIADELEYWRIDISYLAECCQTIYNDHKRRVEGFREMQNIFGDDVRRFQTAVMSAENDGRISRARLLISQFYNGATSSKSLRVKTYFLFYVFVVMLYLISYLLQTEMSFRQLRSEDDPDLCDDFREWLNNSLPSTNTVWQPKTNSTLILGSVPKYAKYFTSTPLLGLRVIDILCAVVFYIDLLLRYMGSVSTRTFITNAGHIMDCLCNICDIIALSLHMSGGANFSCSIGVLVIYLLLEISRVLRFMRLIQFTNRYNGIVVLILTLRASMRELLLLFCVLGAGVVVFGFLIYVAELGDSQNSRYDNFMVGFWWAIVTMTTLGYGDVTPTTPAGYMIGSACAITGVIFVALQVPVIANKFNALYTYACDQQLREQWAKEMPAIGNSTVAMARNQRQQQQPVHSERNPIEMLKNENPVIEFRRQLRKMRTYYTPASMTLFPPDNKGSSFPDIPMTK